MRNFAQKLEQEIVQPDDNHCNVVALDIQVDVQIQGAVALGSIIPRHGLCILFGREQSALVL